MRIIAGECKGRHIKPVPGMSTRPTTDKVRESIYNMIGPFFDGGQALDLYGGSGALGIEALSRGMEKCIFVDRDSKAIETIKWNLDQTKFTDSAEVFRNDSKRALKALNKREMAFSLVLLDPPYHKEQILHDLEKLCTYELLEDNATIVVEHKKEVTLPETIAGLIMTRQETYSGKTTISIYTYEQPAVEKEE
ncbi:16S rRNA (guanine(966)-N(2))-methyltransferase RsmD [Pseudalkalibacillus hwajinpoensis]|uniref:16S rRNA (Guanine(966)-N(2))-methyltransferase RsmD n=1 Tax=Guptibacillus hwajinpoensis TaxID=208199 RepID=A0A4U1MPA2_9BACL|nr:16S rRNA (guanine(966)-N(2))-methyltransferase RsmD [Pseudalkalibacillus hwajinpoensis]TKD72616.1 16S rRNA (guanine(966)-N(2))-methyltransferase RsmD [Pseudalkalibacillus hwajinpoensis]